MIKTFYNLYYFIWLYYKNKNFYIILKNSKVIIKENILFI